MGLIARLTALSAVSLLAVAPNAVAALAAVAAPPAKDSRQQMSARLTEIRSKVISLEQGLIDGLRSQQQAKGNLKKIQELLALQKEERQLGRLRMAELERTVTELSQRRDTLAERIRVQQEVARRFLVSIEKSSQGRLGKAPGALPFSLEGERFEAPRRKVLSNLVDRGLKEIEALKVDLADADQLEARIQEEKQQLSYLFQDLNEQESVLEFNRRLQADILQKRHKERLAQLENYRKLKAAQGQVERLLSEFNARRELEQAVEAERAASKAASKAMMQGLFARRKGSLPLPVAGGKVISVFGRSFDPKSQLQIFRKGIEIAATRGQEVRAVSAGRVAFAGELADYGRVTIVDHGDHFYSLCAHLGSLTRQKGDPVNAGDTIGLTDDSATPVYFEIRARNVAVNPLQWLAN